MIISETNLAPKQYKYEAMADNTEVSLTMKCKGIKGFDSYNKEQVLKPEFYDDDKSHTCQFSGLKRKHKSLTKADRENNAPNFCVVNTIVKRDFNKNPWKGMVLRDNQFCPKGCDIELLD